MRTVQPTASPPGVTNRAHALGRRLLGEDTPADLAWAGALFVVFFVLDRLVGGAAEIEAHRLEGASLLVASIRSNPVHWGLLAAGAAATVVRHRDRVASPWSELEHGRALRWFAAPVVVLLAWQFSLYDANFAFERLHLGDRLLVVVLGAACLWRPALLAPFAIQVRVVEAQFSHPFGTSAAQNIDELLVIVIVACAAVHLVYVLTGRNDTAPVVLLLVAAIATHFWIPGKGKLELGWFQTTDLSNLPLSAYTAGWQGHGDGGWADRMAGIADSLGAPLRAGTMVVEIGAVVAVAFLRSARYWLAAAASFHVVVFSTTGYWFLGWIVVEIGLIVVLTRPGLASWVSQNFTPARGLLGVAAVALAGSTLFHPPGLAWLDASVSYGLEVDLIGVSGRRYSAPASLFAPNEQELTFLRLELDGQRRATGAYGAVLTAEEIDALDRIETFAELRDYEGPPSERGPDPQAVDWLRRFLTSLNDTGRTPWSWAAPPDHFWTSRPEPRYSFQEAVRRLEVRRVRSIQNSERQRSSRELVFVVEVDPASGATTVVDVHHG